MTKVKIKFDDERFIPEYADSGASGADLRAYLNNQIHYKTTGTDVPDNRYVILRPGDILAIPTGITMELPDGVEAQIRPKSGMALNSGITVLNSPGTIDCVPAGTMIKTQDGDIPVEKLFDMDHKIGILSYNEETGLIEDDTVTDMWIVNDLSLLKIQVDGGAEVIIPEEKSVYTKRGWIKAKNLTENDKILSI